MSQEEFVSAKDILAFYAPWPDHVVNDQLVSMAVHQTYSTRHHGVFEKLAAIIARE